MTAPVGVEGPLRVVVAGGGPAALEVLPALRTLAGDGVAMTVLTPRPGADLRTLARQTGTWVLHDALSWVDPVSNVAHTEAGQAVAYDALVIAIGARTVVHAPRAITVDGRCTDGTLDELLADVATGTVRSAAFVVRGRMARIGADDVRVSRPPKGPEARVGVATDYLTTFLRDRDRGGSTSPTRWSPV